MTQWSWEPMNLGGWWAHCWLHEMVFEEWAKLREGNEKEESILGKEQKHQEAIEAAFQGEKIIWTDKFYSVEWEKNWCSLGMFAVGLYFHYILPQTNGKCFLKKSWGADRDDKNTIQLGRQQDSSFHLRCAWEWKPIYFIICLEEGESVKFWCLCTIAAPVKSWYKCLFVFRTILASWNRNCGFFPWAGGLSVRLEKTDMYFWEEKNAKCIYNEVQNIWWSLRIIWMCH